VSRQSALVPSGTHGEPETLPEPELSQAQTLPGQTDVEDTGPHIPAHQVHASPFQAVSLDRSHSWDEPRNQQPIALDSAGNEQAPGANRQFSLELTTYASIPVRNTKSGFRPPHRSAAMLTLLVRHLHELGLDAYDSYGVAGIYGDTSDVASGAG